MSACMMLTWVALKMMSLASLLPALKGSGFPGERNVSSLSRLSLYLSASIRDECKQSCSVLTVAQLCIRPVYLKFSLR